MIKDGKSQSNLASPKQLDFVHSKQISRKLCNKGKLLLHVCQELNGFWWQGKLLHTLANRSWWYVQYRSTWSWLLPESSLAPLRRVLHLFVQCCVLTSSLLCGKTWPSDSRLVRSAYVWEGGQISQKAEKCVTRLNKGERNNETHTE